MTGENGKAPDSGAHPAGARQPLDEVMLAMDIVDTIRRRERLVQRELDAEGREKDLKERLRKIYAAQGIDVPDHVIEEGVAAIKEDRFVYKPAARGISRMLAFVYVTRNRWGAWLLGVFAAVIIAATGYYVFVVVPAAQLPGRIAAAHSSAEAIAETDAARAEAKILRDAGMSAATAGNVRAARAAIDGLRGLRARLEQENARRRSLRHRVETLHARALKFADDDARVAVNQHHDTAMAALQAGDIGAAQKAIASLEALSARLEKVYTLRTSTREHLEALHAKALRIAAEDEARLAANRLHDTAMAAVEDEDIDAANAAANSLETLCARLEQEYTLRIVNRPGEYSGVYRIPDENEEARNYYVIVEAIDSRGNVLSMPILNEETGKTQRVKVWGLRVDESVFNAVANDKKDDGIIQGNTVGVKKQGRLNVEYELATTGAAITRW